MLWPASDLDDRLALRRQWREANEAEVAIQLVTQRQSIAAEVEALGCKCVALNRAFRGRGRVAACPLAIAAAVREGRIG